MDFSFPFFWGWGGGHKAGEYIILPYPPSFPEAQSVSKSGQGEERKGQNRRRNHSETQTTVWRKERVREGEARAAILENKRNRNCR